MMISFFEGIFYKSQNNKKRGLNSNNFEIKLYLINK